MQIQDIFKPYSITERIHQGPLAEVYKGTSAKGTLVALKRLRPPFIHDREFRRRFEREIEITGLIHHSSVPRLLDRKIENAEMYFVLEWAEGTPFHDFFALNSATKSKRDSALRFLHSLLTLLKYLQNLRPRSGGAPGLVHGDLSPKNLLLTSDATARVFDFSTAVWMAEGGKSAGGTWGYMPLPQRAEAKVSYATDLFAAALLFCEALSGKRLIEGSNTFAIFKSMYQFDPASKARAITDDPWLYDILLKLFCAIQDDRDNPTEGIITSLEAHF